MIIINSRYLKQENETDYEHGLRLISIKVEENPSDLDWEDIVSILGLSCHRDSLRKAAAVTDFSGYKVMQYYKQKIEQNNCDDSESFLKELEDKKRSLEKERWKLQTEKLEYNRWMREDARDELFEEKILQTIRDNLGEIEQPEIIDSYYSPSGCGILCIADCHFGKQFKIYGVNNDILNEYSPEIFFMRMNELLSQVIEYGNRQGLDEIKVFNLGDSLDGFLRHSQIWTLRYGVIESAIKYAEYMGKWLNKLSNYFNIKYYQTTGNHGELRLLDGKKNQHRNENIEDIVGYIIKLINEENPNFEYVENKSGCIFTDCAGYNIIGIHGEAKNLVKALNDYSNVYGTKIDYLVCGHLHHSEYNNCGVRRGVIRVGSIMGSDNYSVSALNTTADATASFIIFEKGKGKTDEHTFVLN